MGDVQGLYESRVGSEVGFADNDSYSSLNEVERQGNFGLGGEEEDEDSSMNSILTSNSPSEAAVPGSMEPSVPGVMSLVIISTLVMLAISLTLLIVKYRKVCRKRNLNREKSSSRDQGDLNRGTYHLRPFSMGNKRPLADAMWNGNLLDNVTTVSLEEDDFPRRNWKP